LVRRWVVVRGLWMLGSRGVAIVSFWEGGVEKNDAGEPVVVSAGVDEFGYEML
jgi:hypothetical protein